MITLEPIRSPAWSLRVCPDARDGDVMPKFVAGGVVHIHPAEPSVAHFSAFKGGLTRKLIRELVEKLQEIGITHVHSKRADGHRLPCSVAMPDGSLVTDLEMVMARCFRKRAKGVPNGN